MAGFRYTTVEQDRFIEKISEMGDICDSLIDIIRTLDAKLKTANDRLGANDLEEVD